MITLYMYDKRTNKKFKLEYDNCDKARKLLIKCSHSNHLCCTSYDTYSSSVNDVLSYWFDRQINNAYDKGILHY